MTSLGLTSGAISTSSASTPHKYNIDSPIRIHQTREKPGTVTSTLNFNVREQLHTTSYSSVTEPEAVV